MADEDPIDDPVEPPADDLGDAGKRAIDAERRKAREADKRAKAAEARLKDLEDAGKTEAQKLRDDLADRDAKLADLPKTVFSQAVRFASEAARQGFVDPDDAFRFLGDNVDFDDADAVKASLEELAQRKPHLVREAPTPPKVPARPVPVGGRPVSAPSGGDSAKEAAAAALRLLRGT